ncbi:hypothetical protein Mtc_2244 [Methanocella conradii HZ254]|uniref:Uncharacterized protein n=1 Tax=Methanocella conradii (strain DSM 24694 / JCM 17849 / CGMCC 1.5162 / HZ254) TaxID=1041930 RepID=H8IA19_METCZ|nr:hypothetical protein [Methanocella conradii]AFD00979.1 hypothetical protein Mtc_2244 [Methanocella conradii HZ254]
MARGAVVSIVHTSDPIEGPKKALDMIGASRILFRYDRVLVKRDLLS